jgi:hypothetical protein
MVVLEEEQVQAILPKVPQEQAVLALLVKETTEELPQEEMVLVITMLQVAAAVQVVEVEMVLVHKRVMEVQV